MYKSFQKTILLISSLLLLGACASNSTSLEQEAFSSSNPATTSTINESSSLPNEDDSVSYSNFQRIDSETSLVYEEGFDHILESYEEVVAYKTLLEEKSEAIVDKDSGKTYYTYVDMISYLDTLTPNHFTNKKLYITKSYPKH